MLLFLLFIRLYGIEPRKATGFANNVRQSRQNFFTASRRTFGFRFLLRVPIFHDFEYVEYLEEMI